MASLLVRNSSDFCCWFSYRDGPYDPPPQNSKLGQLKEQVQDATKIMQGNIEAVTQRGASLQQLQDTTGEYRGFPLFLFHAERIVSSSGTALINLPNQTYTRGGGG